MNNQHVGAAMHCALGHERSDVRVTFPQKHFEHVARGSCLPRGRNELLPLQVTVLLPIHTCIEDCT